MISFSPLALAFVEGVALILSPCILPVLPLMLGASIDGSKARPLGIVGGFVLAFTAFAVISRQAILASGVDAETIRNVSLVLLAVFGLVMLFPKLSDKWGNAFQKLGSGGNDLIGKIKGTGFWGGVGIGVLIGIVWTPCAGPILAAAVLQIVQTKDTTLALLTIGAFALGAGIPMGLIAMGGGTLMRKLGFLKTHSYAIRRVIGVIMIAAALAIYAGWDLKLIAWQSRVMPMEARVEGFTHGLEQPYAAPEIAGITDWINSDPLTLQSLKGKVVLIDFWTYSCINCIRTMPYITKWYDDYKDQGLVVIGVHAPEFPFEKKIENVQGAVKDYKINYPVALDNDFTTWRAYKNKYWPAHYLINKEGQVVYTHFGEGNYAITEANIRSLLGITGKVTAETKDTFDRGQTPETYFGSDRIKNFAGSVTSDVQTNYAFPDTLNQNQWALQGPWTITDQKTTAGENASLRINYSAGKIHAVLGSADGQPIDVDVLVDGKLETTLKVDGERLYTLSDKRRKTAILELKPKRAGLEAYALTFGK